MVTGSSLGTKLSLKSTPLLADSGDLGSVVGKDSSSSAVKATTGIWLKSAAGDRVGPSTGSSASNGSSAGEDSAASAAHGGGAGESNGSVLVPLASAEALLGGSNAHGGTASQGSARETALVLPCAGGVPGDGPVGAEKTKADETTR